MNGNLIYSGNTFTTDFLDATTSYYANYSEVIGSENIGSIAHEGSNEYSGSANSSGGLIFDVYKSLILESVDVFTNQAGNRKIILMDSENNILNEHIEYIPASDNIPHTIMLNFQILRTRLSIIN